MDQKMKDLLFNSSSMITTSHEPSEQNLSPELNQHELNILEAMEKLVMATSHAEIQQGFLYLDDALLTSGTHLRLRDLVLGEFNRVLKRLSRLFPGDHTLIQKAMSLTSKFKELASRQQGTCSSREWVELERLVLTLIDWESLQKESTSSLIH